MRARCGGGAVAWVAGFLAAPSTWGSWQKGDQEIHTLLVPYTRRVWQPVLANTLQYSCLENLPPWQRSLEGHSLQGCKELDTTKVILCAKIQDYFLPLSALSQWELSMKVAQLLGLQGPWCCQVCRDIDCLCRRRYGPLGVIFQVSCSWQSEGLFGQSFSIAPPFRHLDGSLASGPSLMFGRSGT